MVTARVQHLEQIRSFSILLGFISLVHFEQMSFSLDFWLCSSATWSRHRRGGGLFDAVAALDDGLVGCCRRRVGYRWYYCSGRYGSGCWCASGGDHGFAMLRRLFLDCMASWGAVGYQVFSFIVGCHLVVGPCYGAAMEILGGVVELGGFIVMAVAGGVEIEVFVARVDILVGCLFLCLVLSTLHLWISS